MGCIGSRGIESKLRICYNLGMGNQSRAAYPLLRRGDPPDERKEGDANVCYIFGLDPDRYLHCSSRRIVLHDLRKKKIAATTPIVTAVIL